MRFFRPLIALPQTDSGFTSRLPHAMQSASGLPPKHYPCEMLSCYHEPEREIHDVLRSAYIQTLHGKYTDTTEV